MRHAFDPAARSDVFRRCLANLAQAGPIHSMRRRQQAPSSVPVAADWVRENIADRVELRSNVIGDLAFFEGAPARV